MSTQTINGFAKSKNTSKIDFTLLFLTLTLAVIGFWARLDTTYPHGGVFLNSAATHVFEGVLGIFALIVAMSMNPEWFKKLAIPLLIISILLLIAVLIPGIGTKVGVARRWIRFGYAQHTFEHMCGSTIQKNATMRISGV